MTEQIHCDCIDRVNEKLAKCNARICQAFVIGEGSLDMSGALILTEQLVTGRGKAKAPKFYASYCPFCGLKYGEKPVPAIAEASAA